VEAQQKNGHAKEKAMVGALKSAIVSYLRLVTYFYKCMQEESEYFDAVSLCVASFSSTCSVFWCYMSFFDFHLGEKVL
jgi:hypothetical protein